MLLRADGWEEGDLPAESQGSTPLQPEVGSAVADSADAVEAVQHEQQPPAEPQAASANKPDGWDPDDDGWQVWRLPCHDDVRTPLLTQRMAGELGTMLKAGNVVQDDDDQWEPLDGSAPAAAADAQTAEQLQPEAAVAPSTVSEQGSTAAAAAQEGRASLDGASSAAAEQAAPQASNSLMGQARCCRVTI